HVRFTLLETVAGYAIGVTLGLLAALAVALTPRLHRVTQPFLIAFYAIPKIALAPLIIIWFGLGLLPKILLASLFVFFIVFLNTVAGVRSVSPSLVSVARVMGAAPRDLLAKIVLPASVPFIIAALRLTIPSAMIGAVVGEFISSNRGLGYLINAASSRYETATVFAGIGSLLIVVVLMDVAVSWLERRLLRWRPAGQAAQRV
ncbi:MAG: ABC transporter permease, partial [Armatimonadetes bacterium]|nr:ABC transporter permease [Armatimonadota bacterium]